LPLRADAAYFAADIDAAAMPMAISFHFIFLRFTIFSGAPLPPLASFRQPLFQRVYASFYAF